MIYLIIVLGVLIIILASVLVVMFRINAREDGTEVNVDKEETSKIHLTRDAARRPRAEAQSKPTSDPIEEKVKTLPKLKKCRLANIKALWREGYINGETYKYLYKKYSDRKATPATSNGRILAPTISYEEDKPMPLKGHKRLIEEGTHFDETRKWGDGFGHRDGGESHIDPRKYKVDKKNARKDIRKANDLIIEQIIQDVREQEREEEQKAERKHMLLAKN